MSLKKIGLWLLLGFFIFFMVQSPGEAADVVRTTGQNVGDILSATANAFSDFLSNLL